MRFTAVAVLVGLLVGYLRGGRLDHMGRRPVAAWPLLFAGVALQLLAGRIFGAWATAPLVLASYAVLVLFAGANLQLVGMTVVSIGMAANATVIALNGAMPVRPSAVVAAGLAAPDEAARLEGDAKRRPERQGDRMVVLADIIPVRPLREVVSFGDLVIAVGVADVIYNLMRPPRRRRRPAAPPEGEATQMHPAFPTGP